MQFNLNTLYAGIFRRLRRHRLFVLLPLFVVIVGFTVRETSSSAALLTHGDTHTIEAGETVKEVALPNGTVVQLQPGAEVVIEGDVVTVERGSLIVAARGSAMIRVDGSEVAGWSGGFHISNEENGFTVASLTAPAVVRHGGAVAIVPAGMQWRAPAGLIAFSTDDVAAWYADRRPIALPDSFLRTALPAAEALLAGRVVLPAPAAPFQQSIPAILRFAAAEKRTDERIKHDRLADLIDALLSRDETRVSTLLIDPTLPAFLAEESVQKSLPLLMHVAARHGVAEAFTASFARDANAWMQGAFHPLLRDHLWTMPLPAMSTQERMIALLSLPLADSMPEGALERTTGHWGEEWSALLDGSADPSALLAQILPILDSHVERLDRLQYPARVRRYAEMITLFAAPYRAALDADALRVLRHIEEIADPATSLESIEEVRAQEQISPPETDIAPAPPAIPSAQAMEQARALLTEYGFMFTADTVLGYREPAFIDITGVVLGTVKGDRLLSFTLDVRENEVSGIIVDGVVSPYGMALSQYVAWVKTEERP